MFLKLAKASGLISASVFLTDSLCTIFRTANSAIFPLIVRGMSVTAIILVGTCRGVASWRIVCRIIF